MDNDVYNFGFILLESLVGPITRDKGETFFINEKVSEKKKYAYHMKCNDDFSVSFFLHSYSF